MIVIEILAGIAIVAGAAFFVAGTIGLLRFPDTFCRLHALTKADGLGLALTCIGVALLAGTAGEIVRLVLIWVLVAVSSATGAHLVARFARAHEASVESPSGDVDEILVENPGDGR